MHSLLLLFTYCFNGITDPVIVFVDPLQLLNILGFSYCLPYAMKYNCHHLFLLFDPRLLTVLCMDSCNDFFP